MFQPFLMRFIYQRFESKPEKFFVKNIFRIIRIIFAQTSPECYDGGQSVKI